ncbi:Uncharacterized protein Rs2_39088 [Raphanus sativus]|uniref:Uncharacterized protein LOC108831811 n=1 Tax=Raphanus sativus TaxID=3726 RepID=A0A6J0LLC7_RAPSA|nr:uncharacterized protein LOC108831811 [Raphanus sativus]XP_018460821.1 uncharacterized protein LOC108831811 [Raphanus sativus]XP_018460822.1 uncharacterized protein LOC108831811 [Raphanus sativus]KAJ4882033.1 Uncharacterized protein Rs2_39088 [Raphanus sativus]
MKDEFHSQNPPIVHRDIKSANVLMDKSLNVHRYQRWHQKEGSCLHRRGSLPILMNRHRKLISFAWLGLWKFCNKMVGLSYLALAAARSKLEKIGSSLRCRRCATPNVTCIIKYQVELCVDDGVDNATFVVFDREMVKLTKHDAAGLTPNEMNGGGGEELLQCVKDIAGIFFFQIRVMPFNFTPSHLAFTVSVITDTIAAETFKTNGAEFVAGEGSEASASAGKKVEDNEPSPPLAGGAKREHKHPRE